jgi:4-hydroxybenzoate polyprenyltransferase
LIINGATIDTFFQSKSYTLHTEKVPVELVHLISQLFRNNLMIYFEISSRNGTLIVSFQHSDKYNYQCKSFSLIAEVLNMFRTRALGRRLLGPSFDYILFLRPRQWPILTCQLAVGILSAPAVAEAIVGHSERTLGTLSWITLVIAWTAWVLCLNGGTLAFNSAFDRDEEDIAYLVKPPLPPRHLALVSFLLMMAGGVLAFLVTPAFGLITVGCILMSVIYSHPFTRWKGIPGRDLVINMIGYGGCTTISGLMVGQVIMDSSSTVPDSAGWLLVAGFALLFGSFYPLTQIYQIETDRKRGDVTLAADLGTRTSLTLAIALGIAGGSFLLAAARMWNDNGTIGPLLPLSGAIAVWIVMLFVWYLKEAGMNASAHEKGMYRALAIWAAIDGAVLIGRFGFIL